MKKKANKILIAIIAIVLVCLVVEAPFIAKTQNVYWQKIHDISPQKHEE